MDLSVTVEEEQFRSTMRRFARERTLVRDGMSATDYEAAWRAFAELGGVGLCVAEERGGLGASAEAMALVAIELGAAPWAVPRLDQTVVVARLLEAADGSVAAHLLAAFVAGETHVVLADWEGEHQHGVEPAAATVASRAGTPALRGHKAAVIGGETARMLLVTARQDDGLALVAIDPAGAGVTRHGYRLADGTPVAGLAFDGAPLLGGAALLCGAPFAAALDRARDEAVVMGCAAAAGLMSAAIRLTIDHLKLRQQFGVPLAGFQALQHRVADLFIVANEARSSVYAALAALDAAPAERQRAVSGCKVKVAAAARHVTGEALHLHGGIGFTTEYPIGHLYRRALVDEKLFGDIDHHLDRHARLSAAAPEPRRQPALLLA